VTARKDDAATAVQAVMANVGGLRRSLLVVDGSSPPPADADVPPFVGPGLMKVGGCGMRQLKQLLHNQPLSLRLTQ
jgi:hypothetical protein